MHSLIRWFSTTQTKKTPEAGNIKSTTGYLTHYENSDTHLLQTELLSFKGRYFYNTLFLSVTVQKRIDHLKEKYHQKKRCQLSVISLKPR